MKPYDRPGLFDPKELSPAVDQSEVDRAVHLWKGIKTALYPILSEPEPVKLWETTRSKIWSLYKACGFPNGATKEGLWQWLFKQNEIISAVRSDQENRQWYGALTHLHQQLASCSEKS
jgi:hypothetical protein